MTITDLSKFDKQRFDLLVFKIKDTKASYDSEMKSDEHLKGYRYNDNERIARMILGYFYSEAQCNYELANKNFLALNSTEIQSYIKKAVLESASADHWYTYEKQW